MYVKIPISAAVLKEPTQTDVAFELPAEVLKDTLPTAAHDWGDEADLWEHPSDAFRVDL